jgi:hypothetical protein
MPQAIDPTPPEGPTDVERLLALVEKWRAEPLGDEDEAVAEFDRALREDPVRFHDLSEWEDLDA